MARQRKTYRGAYMCGRYYVDDGTAREIEKLIVQINGKREQESVKAAGGIAAGDIWPGRDALVLSGKSGVVL